LAYTHWIFDLDNTLADSAIDFDAMRRALDLPLGKPILEEIDTRPAAEAAALHKRLEELEHAYALRATPLPGAHALLAALAERGCPRGILTRNSRANALATLAGCGLAGFFAADHVLGRDEAAPKPDPAGVQELLAAWDAAPASAVMVGDFRYDLEAGRRAGVATIYYDPQDQGLWTDSADIRVQSHTELLTLINGNAS
tara:strand:- start:766 stop:1362 length:597 start_codon:yes stop_codon:yes gene_type:complete